jgi:hypothetical protein
MKHLFSLLDLITKKPLVTEEREPTEEQVEMMLDEWEMMGYEGYFYLKNHTNHTIHEIEL